MTVSSGDGNQWGVGVVTEPTWEYLPGRFLTWEGFWGAFRVWITSVIGQRIMVYRLFTQRVITGFSKEGKEQKFEV